MDLDDIRHASTADLSPCWVDLDTDATVKYTVGGGSTDD